MSAMLQASLTCLLYAIFILKPAMWRDKLYPFILETGGRSNNRSIIQLAGVARAMGCLGIHTALGRGSVQGLWLKSLASAMWWRRLCLDNLGEVTLSKREQINYLFLEVSVEIFHICISAWGFLWFKTGVLKGCHNKNKNNMVEKRVVDDAANRILPAQSMTCNYSGSP